MQCTHLKVLPGTYTHAHHACTSHRSDETAKRGRDNALLSSAYPVHGLASEVNCSDADAQVVPVTAILLSLSIYVEQL